MSTALPMALSPHEVQQGAPLLEDASPKALFPGAACRPLPRVDLDAGQVPTLFDALAATHRALEAETIAVLSSQDLRRAESWLTALLTDVQGRLRASGEPPGEQAENSNGFLPTPKINSSSPDALDDWYTDPWAVSSATPAEASDAPPAKRTPSGSGRRGSSISQALLRNPLEIFLDNEDAATEIEGNAGDALGRLDELLEDAGSEAQWQYGRCVATKLVELSPAGTASFEQLLAVLLAVFEITAEQRRQALRRRREALRRQQSQESFISSFRCFRAMAGGSREADIEE